MHGPPSAGAASTSIGKAHRVFLEPTPTPYDLRWRMFGIPVRVHPTFWLFSAIFGYRYVQFGFGFLLLWIGCMFVSILVHELGHVFAGLAFGQPGHIVLYSFGGIAIGHYHHVRPWQRIGIYCAGPGAGLLLLALVYVFQHHALDEIDPTYNMPYLRKGADMLVFMNLFWNLLNLIPVFPLDGGQISRELCTMVTRRNGFRFSLGLSFLLAGLIAVYSLFLKLRPDLPYPSFQNSTLDPTFAGLMFVLLAIQSFQMMKAVEREQRRWERDDDPW
jgi:stage IV sporulation protein FB